MECLAAVCALNENPLSILKVLKWIGAPRIIIDEPPQRLIGVSATRDFSNVRTAAINAVTTLIELRLRSGCHLTFFFCSVLVAS